MDTLVAELLEPYSCLWSIRNENKQRWFSTAFLKENMTIFEEGLLEPLCFDFIWILQSMTVQFTNAISYDDTLEIE